MKPNSDQPTICNFCNKDTTQVKKLLAGESGTHICSECVQLCYGIVNNEPVVTTTIINKTLKVPSPREIHENLNEHVIAQEKAKKTLSVAIYNHYKRITTKTETTLTKSNVLLAGPTGTGKTLMAQTLSSFLGVPMVITDATTITESGYAGEDAEVLIHKLFQAADYNADLTEHGIIYVDEIDKKAKRNDYVSLSRDVSGEGVQQSLLKLMEGTVVQVPNKPTHNPEKVDIDTTNILFVVGGAFVGLQDVVVNRLGKSKIGFNESKDAAIDNWEDYLQTRDLVKYGLIPEFIGRLPSVNVLNPLNKRDLIRILTEPKDSIIDQIKELFSLDKIQIEFTIVALEEIVSIAVEEELGARGLRKILDEKLLEIQYELPELYEKGVRKIIINEQVITKGLKPQYVKGENIPHITASKISNNAQ
jgi:ATP-dependent Clp protease ATP-binding subunit ClpX